MPDSPPATPCVLVIADPERVAEVVGALSEPLPTAVVSKIEVLSSSGGDEAIELFEARKPHVAVVTATLETGDTAALLEAVRGLVPRGGVGIVVIGDPEGGAIRNAADARELGPDRFVSRPMAPRTLRFAVASALEAVILARTAPPLPALPALPGLPGVPGPPPKKPEAALGAPEGSTREALRRRWEALADSMADSSDDPGEDGAPSGGVLPPPTIAVPPGQPSEPEIVAPPQAWQPSTTSVLAEPPAREPTLIIRDPSEVAPPGLGAAEPVQPRPEPVQPRPEPVQPPGATGATGATAPAPAPVPARPPSAGAGAPVHVIAAPAAAAAEPRAPVPSQDASRAPGRAAAREPGREAVAREARPRISVVEPEPGPGARGPGRTDAAPRPAIARPGLDADRSSGLVRPARDLEIPLDDLGDDLILGGGIEPRLEVLDLPHVPDEAPPAPSSTSDGRDFARQLRAKMSQMAQRLFQGADTPAPAPADLAPRHDHSTEIDLASLGEELPLAGASELEPRPSARAAIAPELVTSPGSWDSQVRERGLPDQGEIVRGVSDAPMLLAKMFAGGSTGRISFRRGDGETVVFFDQGRPVFASSSEPRDRMGELLVREGKITAAQYERCQSVVAESGRRMGEILVDLGYLKRRELLPAVRRHVEDLVYALFGWDRGRYHITIETQPCAERIRLSRHPAALILEGIRRKLDRSTLERLVGPPSTVIEVADRERLGGIINVGDLSSEERAALAAFDGQTDLTQVAHAAGVDVADLLPIAWGLCVLGLATARRPDTEVADEGPALVGETDLAIDRDRVRARWQLVSEADYFALLGVRRDATAFEIRRAYQAARRDFAAEGFPSDLRRELARELEDIASVLDEAFRVLRDDRLRQTYLANLIE